MLSNNKVSLSWGFSVLLSMILNAFSISWFLYLSEVDVPNSVTCLNWTPIFEWRVVMSGSKNGSRKHLCLIEIGPHAQVMITILGSILLT